MSKVEWDRDGKAYWPVPVKVVCKYRHQHIWEDGYGPHVCDHCNGSGFYWTRVSLPQFDAQVPEDYNGPS